MAYKINLDELEKYIDYLRKFKKKLEGDLAHFDRDIKKAHEIWDDNNYEETVKSKEIVAKELKKLINATETSIKKLKEMYDEYDKYLRRK